MKKKFKKYPIESGMPSRLVMILFLAILSINSGMEKATADGWKLSDDCRSVAKEDEMISVQADEALRRYVPCGPDKVATYAKHGNCWDQPYTIRPTYQKLHLNTEGCRFIIAAHCHSLEGRMTAAPGLDVDSAYELCQKYKLPVVGFRHEFNNFADSPELPRIMCTQKWGEITVPVDDWDVYAYVPSKDGRINKVKVEHPQRLFPKLNLIDATERLAEVDKDVIPTEKVTVKPRSGLAPTPPRPTGCSSDGPSSTTKPEFNIGASTKWKVAGGAAGFFATVGSLEYQYQVDTGGVAPKTAETISSVANVADVFLVTGVPQPGSMGGHTPGDMLLAYLAEEFYIRYAAFRKGRFFVDPPTACELEYFRFMGVEPPHEF